MSAKTAYHHGNLRRALLDGAIELIAEKGVDGLSLREVAARAGVSHAAPYHHFADKTALVRSLAFEGMARMDERMAAAEEDAGDAAAERLLAIGLAYVTFAVEEPEYYAAFSSQEFAGTADEAADQGEPEEEHGSTWERLMGAVIACQRSGDLPAGDPVILAVNLWSLVHGLAELWRSAPLRLLPQAAGGLEPLARQVLSAAIGSMEVAAHEGVGAAEPERPARDEEDETLGWVPGEKDGDLP